LVGGRHDGGELLRGEIRRRSKVASAGRHGGRGSCRHIESVSAYMGKGAVGSGVQPRLCR
jgi:hypothetical protein